MSTENTGKIQTEWHLYETYRRTAPINTKELLPYYKVVIACAKADAVLSANEQKWITGAALSAGLTEDDVAEIETFFSQHIDLDKAILEYQHVAPNGSPVSIVYNTIRACSADGKLATEELAALHKVASKLHVSTETVHELLTIYHEEDQLKKRLGKLCTSNVSHTKGTKH